MLFIDRNSRISEWGDASFMKVFDAAQFSHGWFVGDFEPAAYRTKDFEVAYKIHRAGEYWAPHYHAVADEINYLITGTMETNRIGLHLIYFINIYRHSE